MTPELVVVNFVLPLNDNITSPLCTATIAFSLEVEPPTLNIKSPLESLAFIDILLAVFSIDN